VRGEGLNEASEKRRSQKRRAMPARTPKKSISLCLKNSPSPLLRLSLQRGARDRLKLEKLISSKRKEADEQHLKTRGVESDLAAALALEKRRSAALEAQLWDLTVRKEEVETSMELSRASIQLEIEKKENEIEMENAALEAQLG